jgi:hypothetical protein
MNEMKKQIETKEVNTIEQLTALLSKHSKANPTKVYTAAVTFQTANIYEYKNRSSIPVDAMDSRTMLEYFNGICFKNGKLLQPTKGWKQRRIDDSFRVNR